jgi:protein phosphatase
MRIFRFGLATIVIVALLGGGAYGAYQWSQQQFFVGASAGSVAIFRGLPQNVGPLKLSSVASIASDVPVQDLPPIARKQLLQGIVTDNKIAAESVVGRLREQAAICRDAALAPTTPQPSPSSSPGVKPSPSAKASPSPTPGPQGTGTPTSSATGTGVVPDGDGSVTAEECRGLS